MERIPFLRSGSSSSPAQALLSFRRSILLPCQSGLICFIKVLGDSGHRGRLISVRRMEKVGFSSRQMHGPAALELKACCKLHGSKYGVNRALVMAAFNLTIPLMVGATVLVSSALIKVDPAFALDEQGVGLAFQHSCAGCHMGGGNILQPGATLTSKDLQRNGLSTVDDIYNTTYSGKGRMPGFGEKCTPRGQCTFGPRLSDDDIRALAEFVRLQADQGWPMLELN